MLFHGGGWVTGSKDEIALDVLPYLAMGFAVVNVDYRVARVAPAPAAVEDSRCALRWVIRHAPQYGFDPARLVLVGSSAGAHLALMAALAPATAGFDGLCPGNEPLTVAAVINFFGVVDVAELLAPPHPRDFAVGWMGPGAGRGGARDAGVAAQLRRQGGAGRARRCTATPIPVVPFTQATRLHAALDRVGVPNRLVPIRGGRHGDFDGNEVLRATHVVREFLLKRGHRVGASSRSPRKTICRGPSRVTALSAECRRGLLRGRAAVRAHLRQARDQRRQRRRLDRLRRVALVSGRAAPCARRRSARRR